MWDIIIRGAINGALFALIAVGLNLQYGITKILNVAHGEFLTLGAFITSALFQLYGVNPLISLAISGCTVFIVGGLVYALIFRKIIQEAKAPEELEVRSLLACFGLFFIIPNALNIIILRNLNIRFSSSDFLRETVSIFGVTIELNKIVAMCTAIIFSVILYLMLRFTKLGLALRAAAQELKGAQLVGIDISKVYLISFGLSALLGSIGGSLLSMVYYNLDPLSAGAQFTFIALTVIVMGGVGSFIGSLAGGFIVGYIYYTTATLEYSLAMPVVYLSFIIMLLIRPKGIFGR